MDSNDITDQLISEGDLLGISPPDLLDTENNHYRNYDINNNNNISQSTTAEDLLHLNMDYDFTGLANGITEMNLGVGFEQDLDLDQQEVNVARNVVSHQSHELPASQSLIELDFEMDMRWDKKKMGAHDSDPDPQATISVDNLVTYEHSYSYNTPSLINTNGNTGDGLLVLDSESILPIDASHPSSLLVLEDDDDDDNNNNNHNVDDDDVFGLRASSQTSDRPQGRPEIPTQPKQDELNLDSTPLVLDIESPFTASAGSFEFEEYTSFDASSSSSSSAAAPISLQSKDTPHNITTQYGTPRPDLGPMDTSDGAAGAILARILDESLPSPPSYTPPTSLEAIQFALTEEAVQAATEASRNKANTVMVSGGVKDGTEDDSRGSQTQPQQHQQQHQRHNLDDTQPSTNSQAPITVETPEGQYTASSVHNLATTSTATAPTAYGNQAFSKLLQGAIDSISRLSDEFNSITRDDDGDNNSTSSSSKKTSTSKVTSGKRNLGQSEDIGDRHAHQQTEKPSPQKTPGVPYVPPLLSALPSRTMEEITAAGAKANKGKKQTKSLPAKHKNKAPGSSHRDKKTQAHCSAKLWNPSWRPLTPTEAEAKFLNALYLFANIQPTYVGKKDDYKDGISDSDHSSRNEALRTTQSAQLPSSVPSDYSLENVMRNVRNSSSSISFGSTDADKDKKNLAFGPATSPAFELAHWEKFQGSLVDLSGVPMTKKKADDLIDVMKTGFVKDIKYYKDIMEKVPHPQTAAKTAKKVADSSDGTIGWLDMARCGLKDDVLLAMMSIVLSGNKENEKWRTEGKVDNEKMEPAPDHHDEVFSMDVDTVSAVNDAHSIVLESSVSLQEFQGKEEEHPERYSENHLFPVKSWAPEIVHLNLAFNELTDRSISSLIEFWSTTPRFSLRSIDFSYNRLGNEGVNLLMPFLLRSEVENCSLQANDITDEGVKRIAHHVTKYIKECNLGHAPQCCLKKVDLTGNDIRFMRVLDLDKVTRISKIKFVFDGLTDVESSHAGHEETLRELRHRLRQYCTGEVDENLDGILEIYGRFCAVLNGTSQGGNQGEGGGGGGGHGGKSGSAGTGAGTAVVQASQSHHIYTSAPSLIAKEVIKFLRLSIEAVQNGRYEVAETREFQLKAEFENVGMLAMLTVEALSVALRCEVLKNAFVDDALIEIGVFPFARDLFIKSKMSNMVHNRVKDMLVSALDVRRPQLLQTLFGVEEEPVDLHLPSSSYDNGHSSLPQSIYLPRLITNSRWQLAEADLSICNLQHVAEITNAVIRVSQHSEMVLKVLDQDHAWQDFVAQGGLKYMMGKFNTTFQCAAHPSKLLNRGGARGNEKDSGSQGFLKSMFKSIFF